MTTKFGIEIEFACSEDVGQKADKMCKKGFKVKEWDDNDYLSWVLTEDGSVYDDKIASNHYDSYYNRWYQDESYGLELVSPILTDSTKGFNEVKKAFKAIGRKGKHVTVNETCGLHVHVNAMFVNEWSEIKKEAFFKHLIKQYASQESYFDSLVDASRRKNKNQYCRSMKRVNCFDGDRYRKLNISAFEKHGTIEFRHHHGTLSSVEAIKWIKTCIMFFNTCRKEFEASWKLQQAKKKKVKFADFRLAA